MAWGPGPKITEAVAVVLNDATNLLMLALSCNKLGECMCVSVCATSSVFFNELHFVSVEQGKATLFMQHFSFTRQTKGA